MKQILQEPATQERLIKTGYRSIDGRSPADFAAFITAEASKWMRIFKTSGIKVDR